MYARDVDAGKDASPLPPPSYTYSSQPHNAPETPRSQCNINLIIRFLISFTSHKKEKLWLLCLTLSLRGYTFPPHKLLFSSSSEMKIELIFSSSVQVIVQSGWLAGCLATSHYATAPP